MRNGKRIIGGFFTVLGSVYGCFRFAADWIGRSTVADDASQLLTRLRPMTEFVANQPAVAFYVLWIGMIAVGLGLLLQPALSGPNSLSTRAASFGRAVLRAVPFTEPRHIGPMKQRQRAIEKTLADGLSRTPAEIGLCLETAALPTSAEYASTLLLLMRGEGRVRDAGGRWTLASMPSPEPVAKKPERKPPIAGSRSSPNYPYRKAVLQMDKPISSGSADSRGVLESTECLIVVRSECKVRLEECRVGLEDIKKDGLSVLYSPSVSEKSFVMAPGEKRRFRIFHRDLKDVVSNPPHILKLAGQEIPLEDDVTYQIVLSLRSEYEFPTIVTLLVETDRQYVTATVESQTV